MLWLCTCLPVSLVCETLKGFLLNIILSVYYRLSISPSEWKHHEDGDICSLLYSPCPELCLANSKYSINSNWMLKMQGYGHIISVCSTFSNPSSGELSVNIGWMNGSVLRMCARMMARFLELGQGTCVCVSLTHFPPESRPTGLVEGKKEVLPGGLCSQPSGGHLGNYKYCPP